ncbi:hypothetical protein E2C01_030490 [Portunus trituberculatus]|uniref:Uncharacterized protein n=1 Tax=Portunus trituberculatus TaxID=210409 RepID=A0A5B7EVD5_PORTR|nr:hypothetical protein [Portunus trituberculatus]
MSARRFESHQYGYLGASAKISSAQPFGRQTHPIVRDFRLCSVVLSIVLAAHVPPGSPTWMLPAPEVSFTSTSKTDPPCSVAAARLTTRGHSDVLPPSSTSHLH